MTPGSTIATLIFLAWAALSVALPSKSTASPAISTIHVRFMCPPLASSSDLSSLARDGAAPSEGLAVPAVSRGPRATRDRRGESGGIPRHASLRTLVEGARHPGACERLDQRLRGR